MSGCRGGQPPSCRCALPQPRRMISGYPSPTCLSCSVGRLSFFSSSSWDSSSLDCRNRALFEPSLDKPLSTTAGARTGDGGCQHAHQRTRTAAEALQRWSQGILSAVIAGPLPSGLWHPLLQPLMIPPCRWIPSRLVVLAGPSVCQRQRVWCRTEWPQRCRRPTGADGEAWGGGRAPAWTQRGCTL